MAASPIPEQLSLQRSPRVLALPAWYPGWARELADLYFSGTTCVFVVHGNIHDLVRCPATTPEEEDTYTPLSEFLATQVFGAWDLVVHYDLGRGLRPFAGGNPHRQQRMAQ